jgi:acyl-CoA thioesterase II
MNLAAHGPDTYVGTGPSYPWGGLYGGQIVAQALRAADLTVRAGFHPHSLHAYFLRFGDPGEPVRFEVERLRDGQTFAARQVVARQSTGAILNMSASFQAEAAPTMDVQLARPPGTSSPEDSDDVSWSPLFQLRVSLPSERPVRRSAGLLGLQDAEGASATGDLGPARSGEARSGEAGSGEAVPGRAEPGETAGGRASQPFRHRFGGALDASASIQTACSWARVPEDLGPQPAMHAAALAYVSDSGPAWVVWELHNGQCRPAQPWRPVSLDHAMWFHRPFRADDWLLFEVSSASLYHSRGLTQGRVFSRDGGLVATVVQEVFLRRPKANLAPLAEPPG